MFYLSPMRCPLLVFGSLLVVACGSEPVDLESDEPLPGYTRFTVPSIWVEPGESGLWATWVAAPQDRALDIVDVQGTQSKGGHHALLYSTIDVQDVGMTRAWEESDQLTSRFIGGIGGEGAEATKLPAGVVFRVPAGSALLIQTHYLNTSLERAKMDSTLDVKFVEAAPDAKVASLFSMTSLAIDVAPGGQSLEFECVLDEDIQLLMYANHMHELGLEARTKLVRDDGSSADIKIDPRWSYEWAFNPNFEHRTPEAPLVIEAGSMLRTACQWQNTGSRSVAFPDEMCVFFGFYLGEKDKTCIGGRWM
jgi:hypothetical protein